MSDLKDTCLYCGKAIDFGEACDCDIRRKVFLMELDEVTGFDSALDPNDRLSVSEIMKLRDKTRGGIEFAYAAYKLGLSRGKRSLCYRLSGRGPCHE